MRSGVWDEIWQEYEWDHGQEAGNERSDPEVFELILLILGSFGFDVEHFEQKRTRVVADSCSEVGC